MSSSIKVVSCLFALGACGRPDPSVDGRRAAATGVAGEPLPAAERDRDGDGVPDERDRCPSPELAFHNGKGKLAPFVGADGCPMVVMPQACHFDQAPPRAVLGPNSGKLFMAGATVKLLQVQGHKVIALRMEEVQDADLLEDCPEMDTFMTGVVKIGGVSRHWVCRGIDKKKNLDVDNAPHTVREVTFDDQNPCLFDPSLWGISEAGFLAALAADQVHVVLLFHARDGAGNLLRMTLGDGGLNSGVCGFTTRRDAYGQVANVVTQSCAGFCASAPAVTPGPTTVTFPPIDPSLVGKEISIGHPDVKVEQDFQVAASPSCAPADIRVFAPLFRVGPTMHASVQQPLACSITPSGGTAYRSACAIHPDSVALRPGQDGLVADLTIMARTGEQLASATTHVQEPLP